MDQTKYLNTYIDTLMGMIHEQTTQIIQLKTQVRVMNDTIIDKDGIITDLSNKLNSSQNIEQEYHKVIQRNLQLESEIAELANKVSHMNTFVEQINSMKKTILEKDAIIEELNKKNVVDNIVVDIPTTTKSKKLKSNGQISVTGINDF